MTDVECVVIGAGVIGLAVARALACAGHAVIVLERERQFGSQTSSRNSEVVHGGLYYEPGSLKALLCVKGRHQLYDYCESRGIPHRRCGKLIVATASEQLKELQHIESTARGNGATDLYWMEADEACRLEPQLRCVAALCSPSTGIIDSHSYMLSLIAEAEAHGMLAAYGTLVSKLRPTAAGIEIFVSAEDEPLLRARIVVNAAGLQAGDLAASIAGFPAAHVPRLRLAKGSYFALSGRSPFGRLIYPIPEPGGLGIHLTLDLAGRARFGPDVEWVERIDYKVDPQRAARFYPAIRRYWPQLQDGQLQAAYAGIRPKLSAPAGPAADFCISGPADHGIPGVINLFGIESPGLTASLALADRVAQLAAAA